MQNSLDECLEEITLEPMEVLEIEFKEDIELVDCVDKIMTKFDLENNGYLDKDECMKFLEDYLDEIMDDKAYDARKQ